MDMVVSLIGRFRVSLTRSISMLGRCPERKYPGTDARPSLDFCEMREDKSHSMEEKERLRQVIM